MLKNPIRPTSQTNKSHDRTLDHDKIRWIICAMLESGVPELYKTYKKGSKQHARLPGMKSHIITIMLNEEQKHSSGRRKKQICQHRLYVHPNGQARPESSQV